MQSAIVTFTSILFIVDPLAAVPAYLVITQDDSNAQRRRTALRACVGMAVILARVHLGRHLHSFRRSASRYLRSGSPVA